MNNQNPTSLQINEIRRHPALMLLPYAPESMEETRAFEASIRREGVLEPLLVDQHGQLLDGRRRLDAAEASAMEEVPVRVVEEGREVAAILSALVCRRHFTKGQLAYMTFPLLEPMIEEARQYKLACLRRGEKTPVVFSGDDGKYKTVEDVAHSLGFGRNLVFQARKLHEKAAQSDGLRSEIEEAVFVAGTGLGAIIAGLAGQEATAGKARQDRTQLELFADGWAQLGKRTAYWESLDAASRRVARDHIQHFLESAPADLIEEIDAIIERRRQFGK